MQYLGSQISIHHAAGSRFIAGQSLLSSCTRCGGRPAASCPACTGTHSIATELLAEAAVEQAIRELVVEFAFVSVRGCRGDADPNWPYRPSTFYWREPTGHQAAAASRRGAGAGASRPTASVTRSCPPRPERGRRRPSGSASWLEVIGLERQDRDVVVDSSIEDRRGPERGSSSQRRRERGHLPKAPPALRSKNGNLDSVNGPIQIKGVTTKLLEGVEGRPGLADLVTTKPTSGVNINTARREVLRALGLGAPSWRRSSNNGGLAPRAGAPARRPGPRGEQRHLPDRGPGHRGGPGRARITAIAHKCTDSGGETVAVRTVGPPPRSRILRSGRVHRLISIP